MRKIPAIPHSSANVIVAGDMAGSPAPVTLDGDLLRQTQQSPPTSALERRLRRLAFDLHDGALQELSALAAELASMRRQVMPLVDEDVRDRVDGRFDDVQARLEGVDRTLRGLVATVKGDQEPLEALDTKVAREVAALRDESGIEADLEIHGSFADLTESRRIAIFQVVREALSNIRDHSGARHVGVTVIEREGSVAVSVEDDGCGFDRDTALLESSILRRFGLTGMCERVEMLGGELQIDSEPGAGTRIGFVLPAWVPSGQIS
jgi:signal transduction histidine kinase